MALDLSRFNIFKRMDARSRVFFLLFGVIGVIFLIYLLASYFSSGSNTTGPSSVASAPSNLQTVPGSQLTPEYYQALQQANQQAAEQAQVTGGSAVPTLINVGTQQSSSGQCTIICPDESANVKSDLDDWVKRGDITPNVASQLQQLAEQNVPVDDYAAALDKLVKEGKLTPEQARKLLEKYKKQHDNTLLQNSAAGMDTLIKAGQLSIDSANKLLDAQKRKVSPEEYAAMLQKMVAEGKISPEVAQQLLAQYAQQRAKEIVSGSIASLKKMYTNGEITEDILQQLVPLEEQMVPVDVYADTLNKLSQAGKITPIALKKILDEFKTQKAQIGSTGSVNQLLAQAEKEAYDEIKDLLSQKKITPEVAAKLKEMLDNNATRAEQKAVVTQFEKEGKLTPQIAKLKIADFEKVKGLKELAQQLASLQGNNVSESDYADALKRAVQAGLITPEQAAQLMREYQALRAQGAGSIVPAAGETAEFAALARSANATTAGSNLATAGEFSTAQADSLAVNDQDRKARIDAMSNAMAGQAGQLISAWQPPAMTGQSRVVDTTQAATAALLAGSTANSVSTTSTTTASLETPPLIKAGTILFAVLDTEANSDYPDSPIMATVVSGKLKGSKLLGKLVTTKGVAGQQDRITLNFTLMNKDDWIKSKTVTAYAIDPDTARTVLASSVDYHYMQRFGAIMATSFASGYGKALNSSGATSTPGFFGPSTTNPALSPGQKVASAFGQIGETLGKVTEGYVNIPPTVKVDSGVGLGILFMADVT